MKKFHLVIDVANCEDCNNCFLACKDEHMDNEWPGYAAAQPRHGQRWINLMRSERGEYPMVDIGYLPVPCMQCDAAPCVGAGDGAVVKRSDGLVLIDPKKAKGRKDIVDSCPYKAIWWNEEKQIAQKCTGCAHLLDSGWKEPRCVQVCPTEALRFEFVEQPEFEQMIRTEGLEAYHPEYRTRPNVYYKNLHRYTKCFIGGSVADTKNGIEVCVPGARVVVFSGSSKVGEVVSDSYGDFKLDKLDRNSGPYRVEILASGSVSSIDVPSLSKSAYLGVIHVGRKIASAQ
jgi:Fe-S-cluster-containing dehydrogenase component